MPEYRVPGTPEQALVLALYLGLIGIPSQLDNGCRQIRPPRTGPFN